MALQWELPKIAVLTSGSGSGNTKLTAFDKALLDAGIGNLNLVKVTSVLPPRAKVVKLEECTTLDLPQGALIPVVYTWMISTTKDLIVSSAIGVGIPKDVKQNGMIFEASITGPKKKAEMLVRQMIAEAFDTRYMKLKESIVVASEMEASHSIACTVAAALLL